LHNSVSLPAGITVAVPARLHLGFLDLNGRLGRRFGSIGLAISDLGTSITIRRTKQVQKAIVCGNTCKQWSGCSRSKAGME
jgi:predicted sugar kinase